MIRRFLFLIAIVQVLISTLVWGVTQPVVVKNKTEQLVKADVDQLRQDVQTLCSTPKPRNAKNINSLNQAAGYIAGEWKQLGLKVDTQAYQVDNQTYMNLICSFGPEDAERLIIGAHYDVCENQAGADDNASGTAGLLELARLLKEHQPNLNHRIDLVAYTLEEPPYFRSQYMGSAVHAKYLHDHEIKV
ncbi:MAG: M28 family peptidase, partial [Flavobacteriales bacterium]|nr:M28 family peptidase [Flavobacteriales bacterium]